MKFEPVFTTISKKRGLLDDLIGRVETLLKDVGFVDTRSVARRGATNKRGDRKESHGARDVHGCSGDGRQADSILV